MLSCHRGAGLHTHDQTFLYCAICIHEAPHFLSISSHRHSLVDYIGINSDAFLPIHRVAVAFCLRVLPTALSRCLLSRLYISHRFLSMFLNLELCFSFWCSVLILHSYLGNCHFLILLMFHQGPYFMCVRQGIKLMLFYDDVYVNIYSFMNSLIPSLLRPLLWVISHVSLFLFRCSLYLVVSFRASPVSLIIDLCWFWSPSPSFAL